MENTKEPGGKEFRYDFVERVAKANGPELVHQVFPWYFWYENQKSGIELFQKVFGLKEFLHSLQNIPFDHIPIDLEKEGQEAIQAKGKRGDCWSQIGFDNWVSTHSRYLLSSC